MEEYPIYIGTAYLLYIIVEGKNNHNGIYRYSIHQLVDRPTSVLNTW